MRTALDAPAANLDAEEARFVGAIRRAGWFCTGVQADAEGPGFSYTTGFWVNLGAPELIVFGLPPKKAHDILWEAYRSLRAGAAWPTGRPAPGLFGEYDGVLLEVDKGRYLDFLGWNRWFYAGDSFPCRQMIWPDPGGKFPWEAGADARMADDQVDLTAGNWGVPTP